MAAPGYVTHSLSHIDFLISLAVCLTFAMNFELTNHYLTLSLIFLGYVDVGFQLTDDIRLPF